MMGKKLTIFFPNIQPGGTERVVELLRKPLGNFYNLDFIVLEEPAKSSFKSSGLRLKKLPFTGFAIKRYLRSIITLKAHVKESERFLVFGEVPIFLVACVLKLSPSLSRGRTFIACVRNHETTFFDSTPLGFFKRKLFGWSLKKYDQVTANSKEISSDLVSMFDFKAGVKVIYNPVLVPGNMLPKKNKGDSLKILNIGRLDKQKGQDYLISSVSDMLGRGLNVTLDIYGEGALRASLEAKFPKEFRNKIKIESWCENTSEVYQYYDVFCLPSLWEGMPNVLLEAMAHGLPVIAFDCKSGPKEVLDDGRYGKLVGLGNETELTQALESFIHDSEERIKYSKLSLERAQDFSLQKITDHWVEILKPYE